MQRLTLSLCRVSEDHGDVPQVSTYGCRADDVLEEDFM